MYIDEVITTYTSAEKVLGEQEEGRFGRWNRTRRGREGIGWKLGSPSIVIAVWPPGNF